MVMIGEAQPGRTQLGAEIGRVILSGHSGGYHALAAMLDRGGLSDPVREVYLFDGLYGETDKYLAWLRGGRGKLINIYTDHGGTKAESERMVTALGQAGLPCHSFSRSPGGPEASRGTSCRISGTTGWATTSLRVGANPACATSKLISPSTSPR